MPHNLNSIFANPATKDHWIRRAIAYIIDSVILFVISFVIMMIGVLLFIGSVIGGAASGNPVGGVFGGLLIFFVFMLLAFIITLLYWIILDAKGGTIGKRLLKLTPIAVQGEMGYVKAAIRNGSKIVGGFIGGLVEGAAGIIFIGFMIELVIVFLDWYLGITSNEDPRMKFTDKVAGTTVIRTDIQENLDDLRYIGPSPAPTPVTSASAEVDTTTKMEAKSETEPEPEKTSDKDAAEQHETEDKDEEKTRERETLNETVKEYTEFFEIDEVRAQALYDAGYKKLDDFKDAIVEDMILVEMMNPTIARRIIKKMEKADE